VIPGRCRKSTKENRGDKTTEAEEDANCAHDTYCEVEIPSTDGDIVLEGNWVVVARGVKLILSD
jgi:hypothetical protein